MVVGKADVKEMLERCKTNGILTEVFRGQRIHFYPVKYVTECIEGVV